MIQMQFSAFKYTNVLRTFLLAGLELKFLKKLFRDHSLHPPTPPHPPPVSFKVKNNDMKEKEIFLYIWLPKHVALCQVKVRKVQK